ncbi:hypothetical protein TNCV_3105071 [Trichonephila clavipes]|nr:hypothetical protein TNCV_3105071 [Trichonephila clavipes]
MNSSPGAIEDSRCRGTDVLPICRGSKFLRWLDVDVWRVGRKYTVFDPELVVEILHDVRCDSPEPIDSIF